MPDDIISNVTENTIDDIIRNCADDAAYYSIATLFLMTLYDESIDTQCHLILEYNRMIAAAPHLRVCGASSVAASLANAHAHGLPLPILIRAYPVASQ